MSKHDDASKSATIAPETADMGIGVVVESWVNFHEVFEAVLAADFGEPTPDPLAELSDEVLQETRDCLEDVVRAQRYAETLGAVPRRP